MSNSIYVAIPCLDIDNELEQTVLSCLLQSDNPDKITIGISFIGNYEFYKEFDNKFKNSNNIKTSFHEIKGNHGVGKGRILAASKYDNEDYFLQIDSHMNFAKSWDTVMIKKITQAKEKFNSNKVILTAYPGSYMYKHIINENYSVEVIDNYFGYNEWVKNKFVIEDGVIPLWTYELYNSIEDFSLMPKICAAMTFADGDFAKNLHISENTLFWEEEILQSIELINDGYLLVYPGNDCYIYHLHHNLIWNHKGYRKSNLQLHEDFGLSWEETCIKTKNNFLNYLKSNPDKVKKYEEYIGFNLIDGYVDTLQTPRY
jgi:hypothetical protein